MNLLADENIETEIVDLLRNNGYKVDYVLEMSPGVDDKEIISRANKNNSILVTSDKDFGELVFRQRLVHNGVILIRLHGMPTDKKAEIVSNFVKAYSSKIPNSFSVITKSNIRIRSQIN
jgi:predicted nuclease of predicted toxin-antitoxin system